MTRWRSICLFGALALGECLLASIPTQAEVAVRKNSRQATDAGPTKGRPAKAENSPEPQAPSVIGLDQALYLIRSTLLTLDDANRSGNYSVLRDLAAPGAQSRYNPADLAQIFSALRESHVGLSPVALSAPLLSAPPKLERDGELHLTGRFATQPRQINFDLLFQIVDGHWKWLGISVTAPDAPDAAANGAAKSP